ncbi:MAG: radical SAM protein [Candidatus Omnitrophota bacterium]
MAHIVFLQRHYYEYGAPAILSAVLKKSGHTTSLLIGEKARHFTSKIRPSDIVAFSTMTGLHHWALAIASEIKKATTALTVFGGPHPTYFPGIIEHPAVDVICRGEGEYPLLDIADTFDKGQDISQIANLWVKKEGHVYKNELRPLIEDLDGLPFPDRKVYYQRYAFLRKNPFKTFIAGRGCPYRCSFCFNPMLKAMYEGKGKYVRLRSPANLMQEIKNVRDTYGLKTIYFTDDILIINKPWLKNFFSLYKKEIFLPFTCDGRADILDEEIVVLLRESGCFCVRFGIESGNERIRTTLLNKNITNAQIVSAAALLKKYNLKFMTYNMVGIPEETIENVFETVTLNMNIKTDYPRCSLLTPYPGTQVEVYAADRKLLEENVEVLRGSSQQYESIVRSRYKNQILNTHSFFQTAVMFPRTWNLIKRLIHFPHNSIFRLWWAFIYFFVFVKGERRSFFFTLVFAIRSVGSIFEKK